jgi:hypothetical protein
VSRAADGRGARGAVLLEVVLALGLFAAAVGAVATAFDASCASIRQLRLDARGADLAVTLASQLQMGDLPVADDGPNPYDEPLEQWTWQVVTREVPLPADGAAVKQVRIIVAKPAEDYVYELGYLAADLPDASDGRAPGAGDRP